MIDNSNFTLDHYDRLEENGSISLAYYKILNEWQLLYNKYCLLAKT